MEFLKGLVELLKTLLEDTALPDWLKSLVVIALIVLALVSLFQEVLSPVGKILKGLYEKIMRKLFIKRNMYPYFTELTPREVYEAIQYYIPTRYSRLGLDPANEEEPTPENFTKEQEREGYPLLLNRFLETEFDSSKNNRFYFVLADCGMGKTTFLMNLFYYTLLRKKRHPCKYINMVNPGVIDAVKKIKEESGAKTAETILLLDALDENDAATRNYAEFMRELEAEAREFYCVVITSRTNFFEKAEEEHLPGVMRGERVKRDKIVRFYITPFTDNDIQKYLKRRYPWNRKKQRQAWAMIENNRNLAARPMLLKFMDDLLNDNFTFNCDFRLYEKLFDLWISRECDKTGQEKDGLFRECLEIAKAIYRQWEKTGEIGVSIEELNALNVPIPDIKLKGHALLNRTSGGKFKFAHKSYWEYLLAYLALHDGAFATEVDIRALDRANEFFLDMLEDIDVWYEVVFILPFFRTLRAVPWYFNEEENTISFRPTIQSRPMEPMFLQDFIKKSPVLSHLTEYPSEESVSADELIGILSYYEKRKPIDGIKSFSASWDSMIRQAIVTLQKTGNSFHIRDLSFVHELLIDYLKGASRRNATAQS